jgi:hypothetical protein
MGDDTVWQPLREQLQRFEAAGRAAKFWLRDDDAIEPGPALDRLLGLAGDFDVPVTLAVIPAMTGETLATRLRPESHATVAVHGWSHANHAAGDRKKQELGLDRAEGIVLSELTAGFEKLHALYPAQFAPVLVPPWNRVASGLLPQLPALGYRAISVYGRAQAASPIAMINTHVDLMNWHGIRGCRPHEELVANLVAELADRFDGNDEPIGILTHHLVHDDAAWDFMVRLFEETRSSRATDWTRLGAMLG